MEENDIRKARLLWLKENEFGGYAKGLSDKIKRSPSQLGQWLSGHRSISADTARMIEEKVGYPKYWMDGHSSGSAPEPSPMALRLAREFDKLERAQQGELLIELMEQIERATIAPVPAVTPLGRRPKPLRLRDQ